MAGFCIAENLIRAHQKSGGSRSFLQLGPMDKGVEESRKLIPERRFGFREGSDKIWGAVEVPCLSWPDGGVSDAMDRIQ
jgi:hypothetical protein